MGQLVEVKPEDVVQSGPRLVEVSPPGGAGGGFEKESAYQEPFDNQLAAGRVVAGGALKMAEGVATLPFDLADMLGVDNAERVANTIREHFPEIAPQTTIESIGQAMVQYGLPAAAAIKLTGAVLSNAPKAIKFLGEIVAGGLSDIAASTGEEGTLGDIVGGPTQTTEADSAMEKRLKIGAEGAGVPAVTRPLWAAGTFIPKFMWNIANQLVGSKSVTEEAVRAVMKEMVIDPEAAIKEIDRVLKTVEGTGVRPTAGPASGDLGLIALERGQSADPLIVQRAQENILAVSEILESVTKKYGGDPAKAKRFFEEYITGKLTGAEDALKYAEDALESAKAETENVVAKIGGLGGKQAEASLVIDDTVRTALDDMTRLKNNLYAAIDPNGTVKVNTLQIKALVDDLFDPNGPIDFKPDEMPPNIKRLKAKLDKLFKKKPPPKTPAGFTAKKPKTKKEKAPEIFYRDLVELRPRISSAIAEARKANLGDIVDVLTEFKGAIYHDEAAKIMIQGGNAARAAAKANQYFADVYVPTFKKYAGDVFRRSVRSDRLKPASTTAKQFLMPGSGAAEASAQLTAMIHKSPNKEIAQKAIRDFFVDFVATKMGNKKGSTALQQLTSFMNDPQVRETLKAFPDVKKEIMGYKNALLRRTSNVGLYNENVFAQAVDAKRLALRKTRNELSKDATRFYVDTEPVKAIGRALNSGDPEKAIADLVSVAKRDKSGEALRGLRVSLGEFIEDSVRSVHKVGEGEQKVAFDILQNKVHQFLKSDSLRKAMGQLYSEADLKTLGKVNEQLELFYRINKKVTAGSPTAPLSEMMNRGRIVLAGAIGLVKGRAVFAITNWIQKTLGRDPAAKANALLKQTLLDPELAKIMLTPVNKDTKKFLEWKLTHYLLNNMLVAEE